MGSSPVLRSGGRSVRGDMKPATKYIRIQRMLRRLGSFSSLSAVAIGPIAPDCDLVRAAVSSSDSVTVSPTELAGPRDGTDWNSEPAPSARWSRCVPIAGCRFRLRPFMLELRTTPFRPFAAEDSAPAAAWRRARRVLTEPQAVVFHLIGDGLSRHALAPPPSAHWHPSVLSLPVSTMTGPEFGAC